MICASVLRMCLLISRRSWKITALTLDLQDHTHGGIVRLPKLGALYSAEEGLFPEYGGGVYTLDNKATLIVSRGLGDSDKWPRINNVPELSVIDIN